MAKLLPILLLLVGVGGGYGAGVLLAPPKTDCPEPGTVAAESLPEGCEGMADALEVAGGETSDDEGPAEFVRLNDQFVVPVLVDGEVRSLVVLSLSLEVAPGATGPVFEIEPKLRDALLRVLFDHANSGGFSGAYTAAGPMERLRRSLLETTQKIAGPVVRDVLILDLLRQEM